MLNFFRAEAERRCQEQGNTGVIYAIEEPETSQHSDNQRILIEAFKTLASVANTQVILRTHSSFIHRISGMEKLVYSGKDNEIVQAYR